jgi:hypothetical protein
MARHPAWMTVVSEVRDPDRRAWVITFKLARFWWARPSFWIDWFRIRSLS